MHPISLTVDTPRYLLGLPHTSHRVIADLLVIGGGAAGLAAALRAADTADVVLLTRATLPESNSSWAQGGIAAALDTADSPAAHVADTLIAGAGLSDQPSVEVLADAAPALMRDLAALGVPFERDGADFHLGLEGGHSRRRIVHAADATGWAVPSVLMRRARAHPRIRVVEECHAIDLIGEPGSCAGALAIDTHGRLLRFEASATILATGGAGALYGLTSNQPWALGEGIAMAYRAGAEAADMEFVQFHPTVFRTSSGAGFLISEAARGEGALLLTPDGRRFMPEFDPRAELAPRDVVARGIFAAMRRAGSDHVLLDMRHIPQAALEHHFPTITARCRAEGLDPATTCIPVAPAAHYLMGGVRTDANGATAVAGLFAAGECACTGVHGANRLASNSLLECLVFGRRAAEAALGYATHTRPLSPPELAPTAMEHHNTSAGLATLQEVMRTRAGLDRNAAGLQAALATLDAMPRTALAADAEITLANAALTARLIVTAALLREESRGAHFRSDFPNTDDRWRVHLLLARGRPATTVDLVADMARAAA
jgi:L-aspartate oxidase